MSSSVPPATASDNGSTILAFDVHSRWLNLYTEIGGHVFERKVPNRGAAVETQLIQLREAAGATGAPWVTVVCEPSGGYQQPLLRAAKRLGLRTAWVSGEAVARMRVIESNDTGKTDLKDARVIHQLATLGKTLVHRELEGPYAALREWHRIYDAAERAVVEIKTEAYKVLRELFPDFSFKKDFLFGASGQAIVAHYGLNPHRITRSGSTRLSRVLQREVRGLRHSSIQRLLHDAQSSVRNGPTPGIAEILECRLRQLFDDHQRMDRRRAEAKTAMERFYGLAQADDPRLPSAQKGVITTFHLARIVAETGPLRDFQSARQLQRFAGVNLRERASGLYRGKTRLSKKGRSLLRRVLGQVVLPLVRRDALYGPYYHQKKERDRMPGTKAMVAVVRRFLKLLFGWYRSGVAFDPNRVFTCESQLRRAA